MYCMFDRDEQCFSDCDNCVRSRNKRVTCSVCGETFCENEIEYYGGFNNPNNPICEKCLEEESKDCNICDCCGDLYEDINLIYTDDNKYYCEACYKSINK